MADTDQEAQWPKETAMELTPQQKLDGAEKYRRERQVAAARKSGVPPMTRDEHLKRFDENFAKLTEAAKRLGVPEGEASAAVRHLRDLMATLPDGSDFDDLADYSILYELAKEIDTAFRRLNLPMQNGVIISPTHDTRPDAQLVPTFYGDTNIVEVAIPTLWFCNHVAKAMAHTIPQGVEAARLKFEKFRADGTPPTEQWVLQRWANIFHAYATVETPRFAPDQNPPPYWKTHPILDAMKLFMVGHEYAHHAAQGFKLTDKHAPEENYADLLARIASMDVAKFRNTPNNFFLISGAGAPLLLRSLEMLLRTRRVLATGNDVLPASETHPTVRDRLLALDQADKLFPIRGLEDIQGLNAAEAPRFINFRHSLLFILDTIWQSLKPAFEQLHRDGIRPMPEPSDYVFRLLRSR